MSVYEPWWTIGCGPQNLHRGFESRSRFHFLNSDFTGWRPEASFYRRLRWIMQLAS